MYVLLLVALLAVAGPAGADRRGRGEEARSGLARVDSLLAIPDPAAAVAAARDLQRRVGDDPAYGWQVEGRLAVALVAAGEADAALPLLEDMVRRDPRDPAHHRNLGAALLQLGRRGRALSEYRSAVEFGPADPELRREYGQLLLSFRDLRRAARELYTARELCGGCPETDEPLASLHLLAGEPAAAVPYLERIHARAPSGATREALLAALVGAGADSAVVALIARADPAARDARQWRLLVEAEGRLGRSGTSLRMVTGLDAEGEPTTAVPDVVRTDARFWGQVALNLVAAGEHAAALPAVDRAIALDPDSVVHRNNRVVILTALERHDEARAEWDRVLALDPGQADRAGSPGKETR